VQVDVCPVSVRVSAAIGNVQVGENEAYPSMLISFKSPPKYLAYNRDIGKP
jgi:hypothetical protein